MIGALADLFFTSQSDTCNRTVEAANHTTCKSIQPNPLISEFITITIATTTKKKKNWGISILEEFFTLHIFSKMFVLNVCFSRNCKSYDLLVTRLCVAQFCLLSYSGLLHSCPIITLTYDYRLNWTPLAPITIINH